MKELNGGIYGSRDFVLNISLLSSVDFKYSSLALTLESGKNYNTVNIINMVTGSMIKIINLPFTEFSTDSQMQITTSSNEDDFSFVVVGKQHTEIVKYTVRKQILDLCL